MALLSTVSHSPYPLSSFTVFQTTEILKIDDLLNDWSAQAVSLARSQRHKEDSVTLKNYSRFAKEIKKIVAIMANPFIQSNWKRFALVIAKDTTGKVQALGICNFKETTPFTEAPYLNLKAHTCVTHLITAPWNMKVGMPDQNFQKVSGAATAVLAKCSQIGYTHNKGALYVEATEPAEAFYERLGFVKDEDSRNFYNETIPMFLSAAQAQKTFGKYQKIFRLPKKDHSIASLNACLVTRFTDFENLKKTLFYWSKKATFIAKRERQISCRTAWEDYSSFARSVKNVLIFMTDRTQNRSQWKLYSVLIATSKSTRAVQAIAICALQDIPAYIGARYRNPAGYTYISHLIFSPGKDEYLKKDAAATIIGRCSFLGSQCNRGGIYLEPSETDESFYEGLGFSKEEEMRNYAAGTVPMFLPAEKAQAYYRS